MLDARRPPSPAPDAFATLRAAFGDGLSVERFGHRARWSYAGQSAIVDLGTDSGASVLFVGAPVFDEVGRRPARAAYRSAAASYALTPAGAERLVADILDFFTGRREPAFRFAAVTDA